MNSLTAGLVEAYHTTGLPRGLAVTHHAAPTSTRTHVEGDPARLAQVLHNLIDNALSFSPDGGTVTLAVQGSGQNVTITVTDSGPGVPPENRRDVFHRFYSQRPQTEDFGRHSGLGLSIAAAIIKAHGGDIHVEDPPTGRGAAFVIRLPAA